MARYPDRPHVHQYGNLQVKVEHRQGEYVATVSRPSDDYWVDIGTPERGPMSAARYALQVLAGAWERGNEKDPTLLRASQELGSEAAAALSELDDSSEVE